MIPNTSNHYAIWPINRGFSTWVVQFDWVLGSNSVVEVSKIHLLCHHGIESKDHMNTGNHSHLQ